MMHMLAYDVLFKWVWFIEFLSILAADTEGAASL